MKILVDMNLSPGWCEILRQHGWESVHWSAVGDPRSTDQAILSYAREHGYIVFTHDLDFSAILAATKTRSPSVIQIRTQDVLTPEFHKLALDALRRFEADLTAGALIIVDEYRVRARVLPLT